MRDSEGLIWKELLFSHKNKHSHIDAVCVLTEWAQKSGRNEWGRSAQNLSGEGVSRHEAAPLAISLFYKEPNLFLFKRNLTKGMVESIKNWALSCS